MQSSLRPLGPVPRSPPLGPQNSVLSSTLKVRSLLFLKRMVNVFAVRSTALILPARASLGTSNFLSCALLSLPGFWPWAIDWRPMAQKAIPRVRRPNERARLASCTLKRRGCHANVPACLAFMDFRRLLRTRARSLLRNFVFFAARQCGAAASAHVCHFLEGLRAQRRAQPGSHD